MKKAIGILFLAILVIFSCTNENEIADITNNCEFYDNILSTCFYGTHSSYYDEFVFRDKESFEKFGDSVSIVLFNIDCDTATLPYIDFDKYSLLIKSSYGSGCSVNYKRKIFRDDDAKKIIYEIEAIYEGDCEMLIVSKNWAILPKIPNDYSVDFKLLGTN